MEPTWYTVSIVCPACGKENSLTGSIEAFEEVPLNQAPDFAIEHGAVLLREFFAPNEVDALRQLVERTLTELDVNSTWGANPFESQAWLHLQRSILPSAELSALRNHRRVTNLFESIFGQSVMVERGDVCRVVWPNEPPTRPHQDHWYVGGSTQVWTLWFALSDCPLQAGPLAVILDGQNKQLHEHLGEGVGSQGCMVANDVTWTASDMRQGDAIAFHCMTVHRALLNRTQGAPRLSVDCRYQPEDEPVHTRRIDGSNARESSS